MTRRVAQVRHQDVGDTRRATGSRKAGVQKVFPLPSTSPSAHRSSMPPRQGAGSADIPLKSPPPPPSPPLTRCPNQPSQPPSSIRASLILAKHVYKSLPSDRRIPGNLPPIIVPRAVELLRSGDFQKLPRSLCHPHSHSPVKNQPCVPETQKKIPQEKPLYSVTLPPFVSTCWGYRNT